VSRPLVIAAEWVLLGLLALGASPVSALTIVFSEVAGSATEVPGGTGSFGTIFGPVSVDGDAVVFSGGLSTDHGIYSDAGGTLHAVATSGDAIPDGTGGFTTLDPQHFDGGVVPFRGRGSGGQLGIYSVSALGGEVTRVADLSTPIPDGVGTFPDLSGAPDYSGGEYVLSSTVGVYSGIPDNLSVIANTSTAIPGGVGNFTSFGTSTIDQGQVAFSSSGTIYSTSGAGLVPVAGTATALPGGLGNFTGVGIPVVSDGNILFRGTGSNNHRGIYLSSAAGISVIANVFTDAPGGVGSFLEFGLAYAIDGDTAVFTGTDFSGDLAIYASLGGELFRVIGVGDTLHDKIVSTLNIGLDSISGNTIAFVGNFEDGSAGVFTATLVPEPSPWLLFAASLMLLVWTRAPRPRAPR